MLFAERQVACEVPGSAAPERRRRLLFLGESVALAHVGRPAVLARYAQEAGHEVHFACGEAYASAARAQGLHPLALTTIPLELHDRRMAEAKFTYTVEDLDAYVRAERRLIAELRPDLVIGDLRYSMSISACLEGVPSLALLSAYWSPGSPCRFPPPSTGLFRYLPVRPRNALFGLFRPLGFRYLSSAVDGVRRRYGLPPLKDLRRHIAAGDSSAYLDLAEFMPIRRIPPNHFYLGPIFWKAQAEAPAPCGAAPHSGPLVYVTMGSTGNVELLPPLLDALVKKDCFMALSGLSKEHGAALCRQNPKLLGRLSCAPHFDPTTILGRARLTVCHGGSGTVYQSLSFGVPVFCLPCNPDQGLVCAQVLNTGVGSVLAPEYAWHRAVLEAALEEALADDGQVRAAGRMALAMKTQDPRARFLGYLGGIHAGRHGASSARLGTGSSAPAAAGRLP